LKQGATALTESWNASHGASHNHFMLGQVIEWYYAYVAGLRPSAPGFKEFIVAPEPVGDLTWAEAKYHSIGGPIAVRWERTASEFKLQVDVPANTSALVHVPAPSASSVREGNTNAAESAGVRLERFADGKAVFRVGSGRYLFLAPR